MAADSHGLPAPKKKKEYSLLDETFLEPPVIFSDNSFRNSLSTDEMLLVTRYRRKQTHPDESDAHDSNPQYHVSAQLTHVPAVGLHGLFAAKIAHSHELASQGEEEHAHLLREGEDDSEYSKASSQNASFDDETGQHTTLHTGVGMPFAWKSPTREIRTPKAAMKTSVELQRIQKARSLPFYATPEYVALHYNPATRPSVLGAEGLVPIIQAASTSNLLQRDVTDALIVLSAQGDENKHVFGEAGFTEELLNLVESPDIEVRCNAAQSLANLMSHEPNRRDFYSYPHSIERFTRLAAAKVLPHTRVQPGTVRAMRSAAEAIAQLANADTKALKIKFMQSGLIHVLAALSRSLDKETRHTAARGLLWLCRKHGSSSDKWLRPGELTDVDWTSEQLALLVCAADSEDPHVVMQVLLGVRCVCTPMYVSIMLSRTKILRILCKAMKGNLFQENFPLLMAAVLLLSALSQTTWANAVFEGSDFVPILSHLLNLLPKTEEQVISMQSAKGVMNTWDHKMLAQKAHVLTLSPEAAMGVVSEVFPQSFRQLQCYVLVGDVLEVMEKLMLHMHAFREGLFHRGAAQHFITLHLYTRYKVPQSTCLRLLCLMVGSEKLAPDVSQNSKLLEILDFSLRYEENANLPKTSVISIKELSKDKSCVEPLIARGLVQALGHLTKTTDPHMQINLLVAFRNLASNIFAKEQIAQLQQWPKIIRWADSFDPHVRLAVGELFKEMCEGEDSEVCREALGQAGKTFKALLQFNKIDPEIALSVMNFVNETAKITHAQSMFRGVLGRRRAKRIRQERLAERGGVLPTSAVQHALAVFSPKQKIPDEFLKKHLDKDKLVDDAGDSVALVTGEEGQPSTE